MPNVALPIEDTAKKDTQSHLHGPDTLKGKNECHVNNRTALRTIFSYFFETRFIVAQIGLKFQR